MEQVISFLQSYMPTDFNIPHYLIFLAVIVVGFFLIAGIGRLIFGEGAVLQRSVSASIAILCIYVINVVVFSTGLKLDFILTPLPFISLEEDYLLIFPIFSAEFSDICTHILNLVILSFLTNLIDSIMPKGEHLITWYLFRFLSVIMAICLHFIVNLILNILIPAGFAQYAPMILLIVLIASLLLGALKLVVGGLLVFLDPILGILYTFFFSTIVGKQLSKALLTTIFLTALVCLLNYLQIATVYIAAAALIAYLPLLIVLLIIWYVIGHIL